MRASTMMIDDKIFLSKKVKKSFTLGGLQLISVLFVLGIHAFLNIPLDFGSCQDDLPDVMDQFFARF